MMMMMKVALWLLQLLLVLLTAPPAAATSPPEESSVALPGCPVKCGSVSIFYPFGVGPNCYMAGFEVICNQTYKPPKPFLAGAQYIPSSLSIGPPTLTNGSINITRLPFELISISVARAEVRAYGPIAFNCSNGGTTKPAPPVNFPLIDLGGTSNGVPAVSLGDPPTSPLILSGARNKFTAIGCATTANFDSNLFSVDEASSTGCLSSCTTRDGVDNGTCTGNGCCSAAIREGISTYFFGFDSGNTFRDLGLAWPPSTCDYGFIAEQGWLDFTADDAVGRSFLDRNPNGVPFVIDWAVRNMSCEEVKGRRDYACRSANSTCVDSANGPGYICNCSQGYSGNPYLEDGCQDINECEQPDVYPCFGHCTNTVGSYECKCPRGKKGNAYTSDGCRPLFPLAAQVAVGVSGGIVVLVAIGAFWLMKYQERKHNEEREEYFRQNGGHKLNEEMRSRQVYTIQIFTRKELEKVTNSFNKDTVIGHGGRGEVYKGVLEDKRTVAIKKSKVIDESQKEEFVNEIIVLSQINHKNVVRLLGCCLEIGVPMLVYEFVSNGTLFDFIHENPTSPIPLEERLRIATESAAALAYLHSSASCSIIHGDVKSLNILLDDRLMVKVSDFGASKLVPVNESEFVKFVQGTQGYLDPECLSTRRLTEKSDVYSFGVVLLELITRKEPVYSEVPREKRNLAYTFTSMMREHRLRDILDAQILHGGMEILQEVAELALWCLQYKGADRPGMKEVAERLQMLARKQHQFPLGQHNIAEKMEEISQGEHPAYGTSNASAYPSLDQSELHMDGGR